MSAILFSSMFLLIFGWKVTSAVDLILVVSLGLAFWVYVVSRASLQKLDWVISGVLLLLTTYCCIVVVVAGAVDAQVLMRSARATLNYLGCSALMYLYFAHFKEKAISHATDHLYFCLVAHAALIILMFLLPELRAAIYSVANTAQYVNGTASFLLGFRIPGLTYGLATTSVLQLLGLLLLPVVMEQEARSRSAKFLIWIGVLCLSVSILLTGRSGLLFAVLLLPVVFLGTRILSDRSVNSGAVGVGGLLVLISFLLLTAIAIGVWGQERFYYSIKVAAEVGEFFAEGGRTRTTEVLADMYFLPEDTATLIFGSSNLGRGELGYIASDVGYVSLVFAIGIIGVTLTLACYGIGAVVACQPIREKSHVALGVATLACLATGVLLNFKELALLTRNHWSVLGLLIVMCSQARHCVEHRAIPTRNNAEGMAEQDLVFGGQSR